VKYGEGKIKVGQSTNLLLRTLATSGFPLRPKENSITTNVRTILLLPAVIMAEKPFL
jgi:hypothetical protein